MFGCWAPEWSLHSGFGGVCEKQAPLWAESPSSISQGQDEHCVTPCLHGPGFLELYSHEKRLIDHVIFFFLLGLKPAGSSPEIQYVPPHPFFFSRYVSAQRGTWKETAVPIPAGAAAASAMRRAPAWSCCSYRYEACTCMELGDWRFVREGNIVEHQDSKARGMDGSGVANWIPLCSPGGHGITPDLN